MSADKFKIDLDECRPTGAQLKKLANLKLRVENARLRHALKKANTDAEVAITDKEEMLEEAYKFLKAGKAKFTPNTTNSLVDNWLKKYEDRHP